MKKIMERLAEKKSDDSGFSLLELVIAIGIILVLTVGGLIGYGAVKENAKKAATQAAASEVATAALAFDIDGTNSAEDASAQWNETRAKPQIETDSGVFTTTIAGKTARCVFGRADHVDGYSSYRVVGDDGCDSLSEDEEDGEGSETPAVEQSAHYEVKVNLVGEYAEGKHTFYIVPIVNGEPLAPIDDINPFYTYAERDVEKGFVAMHIEEKYDSKNIPEVVGFVIFDHEGQPIADISERSVGQPVDANAEIVRYDLGDYTLGIEGSTEEPVITGPDYVEKFNCPAERPVRVERHTQGDRTYLQSREAYIADNGNADGFDESFANQLNNDGEAILFLSLWSCDDISRDDITVTAVPVSGNGTTLIGELLGPSNVWFYGASRGEYRIEISGATLVSDPTKSAMIHVDENGSFSTASGAFDTSEYTIIAK